MLDLKALEENPEELAALLRRRGEVPSLDEVLTLAKTRKERIAEVQVEQEKRNAINKEMKGASREIIDQKREEMRALSGAIKEKEVALKALEEKLEALNLALPNIPYEDVPVGAGEEENVLIKRVLEARTFDFEPKDHVELGTGLDIVDFERGAKLSGARFSVLKGQGAKLSRAIAHFMLEFHLDKGDTELAPPLLVATHAVRGTGQLPKFEDDLFKVPRGDQEPLYLIPTAEVPLTNYYADEILEEEALPKRLCAFTPCFRAEAGAAGRDTRGLIRQHQFDKVEMVRLTTPEQSANELQEMVQRASDILSALELPHQIMKLCTGDMGVAARETYDLEVWLPGQNRYREISSCSRCGDFQSRRAKIRYRPRGDEGAKKKPKPRLVNTLNGSGLAVGRTWLAVIENHQNKDGSVTIPKVLVPFMGVEKIVPE